MKTFYSWIVRSILIVVIGIVIGCSSGSVVREPGYLELAGRDSVGWTFNYMFEPASLRDSMQFYSSPFPIVKRQQPDGLWITLIYTYDGRWIVLDKEGKLHVRAYTNPDYEAARKASGEVDQP